MNDRYVDQKYNPLFSARVIDRIYKYCELNGYTVHTYNAEYDDIWFVASKSDGTKILFAMNPVTFAITVKGSPS